MAGISQWSTTAGSNNATPPDGWPENMAPSGVNNAARENMAAERTFYNTLEWREFGRKTLPTPAGDLHTTTYASATTFTTASGDGDTTGTYTVNRRIRAVGTTTTTIYGRITASSHSGSTTVTVDWDSGTFANDSDLVISLGMDPTNMPIVGAGWEPIVPATAFGTETEIEIDITSAFDYRIECYAIAPSADDRLVIQLYEAGAYVTTGYRMSAVGNDDGSFLGLGPNATAGNISTPQITMESGTPQHFMISEIYQAGNANVRTMASTEIRLNQNDGSLEYFKMLSTRDNAVAATKFKLFWHVSGSTFASNGYYVVKRMRNGN